MHISDLSGGAIDRLLAVDVDLNHLDRTRLLLRLQVLERRIAFLSRSTTDDHMLELVGEKLRSQLESDACVASRDQDD